MFWAGNISQQQKQGVIVCLQNARGNQTPEDYRPITLTPNYKILACIIPRLCPVLAYHLTETQFCGVPGNTIIVAKATVRDTIVYAESRIISLCVLSLDFKNAFDRIAHVHPSEIWMDAWKQEQWRPKRRYLAQWACFVWNRWQQKSLLCARWIGYKSREIWMLRNMSEV